MATEFEIKDMVRRILEISEVLLSVATEEEINVLLIKPDPSTPQKMHSNKRQNNSREGEK